MSNNIYNIIRYYQSGKKITILKNLTLEEAQCHCKDPETSSKTCKSRISCERTKRLGPWFEGFTAQK